MRIRGCKGMRVAAPPRADGEREYADAMRDSGERLGQYPVGEVRVPTLKLFCQVNGCTS